MKIYLSKHDQWKTDAPEPRIYGQCTFCKNEIYEFEFVYITDDEGAIHEDCLKPYAIQRLGLRLGQVE